MSESQPEEANINDFWDAIQEIVNSEYVETPSPNAEEDIQPQQSSFTFDLFGGSMDEEDFKSNKLVEQQTIINSILSQNDDTKMNNTLFTPVVQPAPSSSLVMNFTNNAAEIAYLKSMLQQGVFPETYSAPNNNEDTLSVPAESDNEDDDDEMQNVIVDSIDVKLEDMVSDPGQLLEKNETDITDEQLTTLSVRDLNKVLRNYPRDQKTVLKQRRRLLKNRGYAQNCRNRRLSTQRQYAEENKRLKDMLEAMTGERNLYKTKYENLKTVIRKAKNERERRKGLEDGISHI